MGQSRSIIQGVDATNTPRDILVLADGSVSTTGGGGGGGGGAAQLQVRNALDTLWVNVGPNGAHVPVDISSVVHVDDNGGSITVDGPLTDAQLRAAGVPVSGPLTDAQLRAAGVPVTGTFWQATQPVSGPVTDAQLRASAVPVSGPVTDAQLRASAVPVSGPLTDAQLRASAVSVDVSDRAAREVGRTRIWDGTDEVTVVPMRTQPAATEKGIPTFEIPNRLATYSTATAEIAPAITAGVKELLAIWSAVAGTKDKYIVEVWITGLVTTASTAGRTTARISTITTAPTGGGELGKADVSGAGASDMTNTMSVKTGGGAIGTTFVRREAWHATQAVGSRISEPLFQASNPGNGIILRAGSGSGISIDIERAVAHTALVDQWTVSVRWLEV